MRFNAIQRLHLELDLLVYLLGLQVLQPMSQILDLIPTDSTDTAITADTIIPSKSSSK